jgi:phasin family protein
MADVENTAFKADTQVRKVEKIAEKVTAQVTANVEAAQASVKTGMQDMQAKVTTGMQDVQAKVTDGLHRAAEAARTAAGVQRETLETVVKAGQIYGQGLQGLATHAASVSRVQFEDTMAHLRALTSVKSVREAVELQSTFARNTASRLLAESSTFVEDYLKVAGEALAPVTTRVREAAEKVKKAV